MPAQIQDSLIVFSARKSVLSSIIVNHVVKYECVWRRRHIGVTPDQPSSKNSIQETIASKIFNCLSYHSDLCNGRKTPLKKTSGAKNSPCILLERGKVRTHQSNTAICFRKTGWKKARRRFPWCLLMQSRNAGFDPLNTIVTTTV